MDYCDKPREQEKNPGAKDFFAHVANGDANAYLFCWRFWCYSHMIDDLVDRDVPDLTMEDVGRECSLFMGVLALNPFFVANAASLFPLLALAFNRWLDGEVMSQSEDPEERIMSRVVRSGDVDLYAHVAMLTGGWEHMRSVGAMATYDPNKEA